jgi:hypothetical protein
MARRIAFFTVLLYICLSRLFTLVKARWKLLLFAEGTHVAMTERAEHV